MYSMLSAVTIPGYQIGDVINEGTFGHVFKCRKLDEPGYRLYAAKIIKTATPEQEIIALKYLKDTPGIIQYHADFHIKGQYIVVLTDFVHGDSLFDRICRGIPEDIARMYFKQMCSTMHRVHERGIVHRDLKPENMIVDSESIVIADWGMAFWPARTTERKSCGSPHYAAPELIVQDFYDHKVDVWSLGVILYAMLTTALPFNYTEDRELFSAISTYTVDYAQEGLSPEAVQILKRIFVPADRRIDLAEILEDPWLAGN